MIIRIAFADQIDKVLVAQLDILRWNIAGAGFPFMMDQLAEGCIQNAKALVANPQAEFNIAECHEVVFVKAAHLLEYNPAGHQAGAGNRQIVTIPVERTVGIGLIAWHKTENMAVMAFHSNHDSSVLNGPIWEKQFRAYHANAWNFHPAR